MKRKLSALWTSTGSLWFPIETTQLAPATNQKRTAMNIHMLTEFLWGVMGLCPFITHDERMWLYSSGRIHLVCNGSVLIRPVSKLISLISSISSRHLHITWADRKLKRPIQIGRNVSHFCYVSLRQTRDVVRGELIENTTLTERLNRKCIWAYPEFFEIFVCLRINFDGGATIRVEINMPLRRTLKKFCRHEKSNPGTSYPGHGAPLLYVGIKSRQCLNNNEISSDIMAVCIFFKILYDKI